MDGFDTDQEFQIFVRDGMPGEWLWIADELQEAAEILWTRVDGGLRVAATPVVDDEGNIRTVITKFSSVSRPCVLLAGFAIENLLKGLMVAHDPSLISSGRISSHLKSHNLLCLSTRIPQLALSEEETEFCRIAQDAIPYWGRYPIPLSSNGVLPEAGLTRQMRHVYLFGPSPTPWSSPLRSD